MKIQLKKLFSLDKSFLNRNLNKRSRKFKNQRCLLYEKCEGHRYTIILIKTNFGKVLGAFATENWEQKSKKNIN